MGVPPKPNFKSIADKLRADLDSLKSNPKRKKTPDLIPSSSVPPTHPSNKKLKVLTSRSASPSVLSPVNVFHQNDSDSRKSIPKPISNKSNTSVGSVEILSDTILIDSSNHSLIESPVSSSDVESVKKFRSLSFEKTSYPEATDSNFSSSYEDSSSSQVGTEDLNFISLSTKPNTSVILTENHPWFCPDDYSCNLSTSERLNKEAESVVKYLSPTDQEIKLRKWIFSHVKKAANLLWPTSTVHMFGSFSTKLFIPTSDVDIVIMIPGNERMNLDSCLTELHSTINKFIGFSKSEIRKKARVPIINFVEQITGLEVDVNINALSGIDSCDIVTRFIRQCPAIRPLNMILKHFLELNDLNKVFYGGLSSYALTLLVVNFLQIHPFIRSGQMDPMNNLGILLVEFLELYGVNFNFNHVGITLTNGGRYYTRSTSTRFRKPNSVSLELLDPQDESNNVTSGSFNFGRVKTSFAAAYAMITDAAARYYSKDKGTSFLEPLLGQMLYIPNSTIMMREGLKRAYHLISKSQPSASS